MKKIFKVIAVISVVLLVGSVVLHKKCGETPLPIENGNEFKLPVETYRPPIVKIPFKRYAQPIKAKNLPIPTKDVAKTITIGTDVVIVIDKKGKIYTTKDTPKDIPIKVTVWKRKALAFENKWGATLAMSIESDMYFCLSWSFFRVGNIHVGVDAGMRTDALGSGILGGNDFLLGVAGRYKILKKNEIYGTLGYEFTHKTVYLGVTIIF